MTDRFDSTLQLLQPIYRLLMVHSELQIASPLLKQQLNYLMKGCGKNRKILTAISL